MWLRPHSVIDEIARVQVPDYSDHISINVDSPPPALGEPVRIAKERIPDVVLLGAEEDENSADGTAV